MRLWARICDEDPLAGLISNILGAHTYNYIRAIDVGNLTGSLYRCVKRHKGCPAEMVLQGEHYLTESHAEHSHLGNVFEVAKIKIYAAAKAKVRLDPKRGVDEIVTEVLTGYSNAVQRRIKRKNLERALYYTKERILNYPTGSTTPMELEIPDEWAIHPDGEAFVIADERLRGVRMLILSHPRSLRLLGESAVVAGDGTFEMRFPPQNEWKQLYMLHGYVGGTFIPLVGIASNAMTARFYATALQYVKDYMAEVLEIEWEPAVFLSDFEMSVISAVRRVFTHDGFIHKGIHLPIGRGDRRVYKLRLLLPFLADDHPQRG